jgi:DNA-binding SARP family transcriptional activator
MEGMLLGLKVTLFGKFNIVYGEEKLKGLQVRKVQELLCYLLLSQNHPQSRDTLAELLWGDQPPEKSKKNLRQTLWRLQSALSCEDRNPCGIKLQAEGEWIKIEPSPALWLDVNEFEQTYNLVKEKYARELTAEDFAAIQKVVALYQGDLLEGWYQNWCVFERERFQTMHLMLLDKLVQYCEVHQQFDLGLAYGGEILRHDRAYERTHRQMMRLYYMAGDRTQAIHQYERCKTALREELEVEPSQRTQELYEQIRSDVFEPPLFAAKTIPANTPQAVTALNEVLDRLERFSEILVKIETQVQQEISVLENVLSGQK